MATLTDEMKAYIADNLGYVATVDADGNPDLGPKMSLRVLDDHRLIYNEMTGKTIMRDIDDNGKILVAFANLAKLRGYRFGGKATLYRDGEYFEIAQKFAEENQLPAPIAAGVIDIETIWTLDPGPKAGELYRE
ncbi:pyridoxamine 5'-phosphate oxidase family protein [Secundilactobacillus folii]|uniref:Pyridoxamine 5'-phosphate oxidase n=1 Tax=Secundilactobacillus folii TaxID=2678357 RepID=A0A7X2XX29_9LACO|nr:pyridoxamine 5'-phosphate oxidase family protein [Secundilactobacillus folii]MTV83201.1 pyridoxamine 5'-phosphate oxidase [Secundilactobacillus folii]